MSVKADMKLMRQQQLIISWVKSTNYHHKSICKKEMRPIVSTSPSLPLTPHSDKDYFFWKILNNFFCYFISVSFPFPQFYYSIPISEVGCKLWNKPEPESTKQSTILAESSRFLLVYNFCFLLTLQNNFSLYFPTF